jgi:RNA polymerase sigma-70 factor (ECF subfamily)
VHRPVKDRATDALRPEAIIRSIIQRHNRRLYRIARGILRDDAEAEDAMQDAYLKAFVAIDQFRGEAAIGTWLCRIVMNEALGRLRRRKSMVDWETMEQQPGEAEIINFPGHDRADPETAAAREQLRRFLETAIDALPDEFRLVLIARAVEDMSVEETAALLGIRPETVKTRLHRARLRLKSALEARVGSALSEVYPFEDRRCMRIADAVIRRLEEARREPFPVG